jgi:hypothetical protein
MKKIKIKWLNALNLRIKKLTTKLNKFVYNLRLIPYAIHKQKLNYIVELETELNEIKQQNKLILKELAEREERWERRFNEFVKHFEENRKIDDYQIATLMLHSNMPKKQKEVLKMEVHEMKHELIFYRWNVNGK